MYAAHFGLSREPFSLAPDPRFLFMSARHREALAHLLYGVRGGGGFVLLTGEIGAGKTTVVRGFLEQLPKQCVVAYVFNPKLTAIELLQTVCHEFGITGIADAHSGKAHVDALNRFLLDAHAQGRQALLVIDEAQALDPAVLEQLRLLTNLETSERKLLQIVLVGQPELREMLAAPGMEQVAQRVIARYHLGPLTAPETAAYVAHRLGVAGAKGPPPFDAGALAALHRFSGGVPRRINLLADRALLGTYAQHRHTVGRGTVKAAAHEVFAGARATPPGPAWRWAVAGVAMLVLAAAGGWWWYGDGPAQAVVAASPRAGLVSVLASASASASAAAVAPVASSPAASAAASSPTVVAAAPPPAPAPLDDGADLLVAAYPDESIAWRELALRWNVAIGEGDPCVAVQQARLACFKSANGGLQQVRQLGRPVLLPLRAEGGPRVHALLVALSENQATLQVGARRFAVTLPALVRIWRGEYATLWRTPPGWRANAPVESLPDTRAWVQQQLAAALPAATPAATPAAWGQRITAYQVLQGLPVDGRAGPITLMQLNRSAGVDEPRLADVKAAGG